MRLTNLQFSFIYQASDWSKCIRKLIEFVCSDDDWLWKCNTKVEDCPPCSWNKRRCSALFGFGLETSSKYFLWVEKYIKVRNELINIQEYGHCVRLATHSQFDGFVSSAGVNFYPLGGDPRIMAECKTFSYSIVVL